MFGLRSIGLHAGDAGRALFRVRSGDTVLILIAAVIGLATGGVILLFNATVEQAGALFNRLFEFSQSLDWWEYLLFPLVPAIGGLLVGVVNHWIFRRNIGQGIPEVIRATRFSTGRIPRTALIQKLITASLSIGSGGGGGREGPIVHVGAAVGSLVARTFGLGREHTRTLLVCGAAAGISGIFNAPMGGVMFALEVILGDFRLRTFAPVMVASVASTALTRTLSGAHALVHVTGTFRIELSEYLLFAALGIVMGAASVWFIRAVEFVERGTARLQRLHPVLRPAVGGVFAGLLALFLPLSMEQTYHPINAALMGTVPVWMLLAVALLKPVHAALTIGSGGSGGVFAPALKTGAMLGSVFGMGAMALFPGVVHGPTAYALAGMGAVLAATMQAPLTGILMLVEIAGNYTIVLPGMLAAIIASAIAMRVARRSVYSGALERDGHRIGSYAYLPLLNSVRIDELVQRDAPHVAPSTPMREVFRRFEESPHEAMLVLGDRRAWLGMIRFEDVRRVLTDAEALEGLVAADVMSSDIEPVRIDDTLDVVLRRFDTHGWEVLPVLDDSGAVGIVTVADAHTWYRRSVARET